MSPPMASQRFLSPLSQLHTLEGEPWSLRFCTDSWAVPKGLTLWLGQWENKGVEDHE